MLELGEGVGVEEVTGAVDDTDVEGCTELLIDVATLDTDLVDVEMLDTLMLLDGTTELQTDDVGIRLVVGGATNELNVITSVDGCTEELGLALKMLELGESSGIEEVIGAVDDTDVDGCIELVIDDTTLNSDLNDVETLDTLALLDGTKELQTEEVGTALVVGGAINELNNILVGALKELAKLELGEEQQYTEDDDEYIIDDDDLTAEEELRVVEAIWVPLDVGELLSLNTVLKVVVDGAMLLDMAILEEE